MIRKFSFLFLILGFLAARAVLSAGSTETNTAEVTLRAALRDSTLQLRTAQAELATAQGTQAALAEEKKALADKCEALKKQLTAELTTADKTKVELMSQLSTQKAELVRLNESLEKLKADLVNQSDAARVSEAQRVKLVTENSALQRKVSDRESKNIALFMVGNEILTRYEDFSLGKALAAKEPFVGNARVKLENLMQDFQDKLLDQRVRQ
jgi:chromosome segregation ATPase